MKAYAALRKGEISMSLGHGLRILEIIITTYCGIKLTVGKEKNALGQQSGKVDILGAGVDDSSNVRC